MTITLTAEDEQLLTKPKPCVGSYFKFNGRLYYILAERANEDKDGKFTYEFQIENCETLFKDWVWKSLVSRCEVVIPSA